MTKNAYPRILIISVYKTTYLNFIILDNHLWMLGKTISEQHARVYLPFTKAIKLLRAQQAHPLSKASLMALQPFSS